jgi:hypothetical protein
MTRRKAGPPGAVLSRAAAPCWRLKPSSMRRLLLTGLPTLVACGALTACVGVRKSEMVLAAHVRLAPRGSDIKPSISFRAAYSWSELLLELPAQDGPITGERAARLKIGGYLTTLSGERVTLDVVRAVDHGGRTFLQLSSGALQGQGQGLSFLSVTLWSDEPIAAGRLVWLSYDPRTTTEGAAWPDAFR